MSAVYPRKTTLETRGARKSRCTPSILGLRRGQQQSRLREIIPRRRGRTAGTVGTQGASVGTDRSRSSKAVREQTGCRVSGSPVEKWSRRTQRPRGETVVRRHARCASQQQHPGQRPRQRSSGSGRPACSRAARKQARKEVRVQGGRQRRAQANPHQPGRLAPPGVSQRTREARVREHDRHVRSGQRGLLVGQSGDCCHQGCTLRLGSKTSCMATPGG